MSRPWPQPRPWPTTWHENTLTARGWDETTLIPDTNAARVVIIASAVCVAAWVGIGWGLIGWGRAWVAGAEAVVGGDDS